MSNANKIIFENDLNELELKIMDLNLLKLMRITKKAIYKSRPICFHFILKYSKKFENREDYQKEYLNPILILGCYNNSLYVLETIFKLKSFNKDNFDASIYFNSYDLYERITLFLKHNLYLKNININTTKAIFNQIKINDYNKIITKNNNNIKHLIDIFKFNERNFFYFLTEKKERYENQFDNHDIIYFKGLFSFLEIYVDYIEIYKYEKFFTIEDQKIYRKKIIEHNVKNF
jgi:hypothetical protein